MTAGDLYKRGSDYFKERRWKNAIQFFSRAIKQDPLFPDAYIKRGKAYCEQDEPLYNLAICDFNKAVRLKPDESRIYRARGNAYYMQGKYQKAIGDCNRSLRIEPEQSFLYVVRALSYLCEERNALESGEVTEQFAESFDSEAEALAAADKGDSAEDRVIRPLQATPDFHVPVDPDSYVNQAVKGGRGATLAALEDLSKAILINSDYGYAYWCRGNIYLEHSLFDTAIVEYTEAVRLASDDIPDPYFRRAQAYSAKGWHDQALRDFNQAIARDSSRGDFFWLRGEVWESMGDYEKAQVDFENAQKLGYCEDEED